MADTQITTSTGTSMDRGNNGVWGTYWLDKDIGAKIHINGSDDVVMRKTIDGGDNWVETVISTTNTRNIACWFDQETPGDTGVLIHVTWLDNDGSSVAQYRNINITTLALSSEIAWKTGLTISSFGDDNNVGITKSRSGAIYVCLATPTNNYFSKATTPGGGFNTKLAMYDDITGMDRAMLFPCNTSDSGDICALYWDASANNVDVKVYDSSTNTWANHACDSDMTEDAINVNIDGAIRHSDGHLIWAGHSNDDSASDDIRCWDVNLDALTPTMTQKTNVITDTAGSAQVAIIINQINDDIYVAYLKGTWRTSVDVFAKKSEDGGATWSSLGIFNEDVIGDTLVITGGRTIGTAGGRVQWVYYSFDDSDLSTNLVNATVIGPYTTELEGFRFGNDDGNEASLTWKAAQDVSVSLDKLDAFGLRTLIDTADGDPESATVTYQYKRTDEADSELRTIG